jgi:hypothetical protein
MLRPVPLIPQARAEAERQLGARCPPTDRKRRSQQHEQNAERCSQKDGSLHCRRLAVVPGRQRDAAQGSAHHEHPRDQGLRGLAVQQELEHIEDGKAGCHHCQDHSARQAKALPVWEAALRACGGWRCDARCLRLGLRVLKQQRGGDC